MSFKYIRLGYGTKTHSVCANEQLRLVYIGIHHITKRTRGTNLANIDFFSLTAVVSLGRPSLGALCL